MTNEDTDAVITALRNAPGFEAVEAQDCSIERLGGMTNKVYLVATGGQSVIVRIPGAGTEAYIDRKVELHNAKAAWRAGVSAEVLWGDPDSGVMISRAIDDIETMSPSLFKTRAGSPARAGEALSKLHNSGETFEFRFELFAMIEDYLKVLADKDATLPDGYHDIVAAAEPVKQALEAAPAALAPCHCDPLCENFLDDGSLMWVVDWEYSGMNDPLWDVGDVSVEAGFDEAQDDEMLRALFRPGTHRCAAGQGGHLQGDVRPALDALGPDSARGRQSGGRFLGLFGRSFRTVQGPDERPVIRRASGRCQERLT